MLITRSCQLEYARDKVARDGKNSEQRCVKLWKILSQPYETLLALFNKRSKSLANKEERGKNRIPLSKMKKLPLEFIFVGKKRRDTRQGFSSLI